MATLHVSTKCSVPCGTVAHKAPWPLARAPLCRLILHSLYLLTARPRWALCCALNIGARSCLRAFARAMSSAWNAFPQVFPWLVSSHHPHSGLWSNVTFSARPFLPAIAMSLFHFPTLYFFPLHSGDRCFCWLSFVSCASNLSSTRRPATHVSPAPRIIPGT